MGWEHVKNAEGSWLDVNNLHLHSHLKRAAGGDEERIWSGRWLDASHLHPHTSTSTLHLHLHVREQGAIGFLVFSNSFSYDFS